GTLRMVGGVVSTTCRETFAVELFPAASVTVTAIMCWPTPMGVPAAGFWLSTNWLAGVQLSVATTFGRTLGTTAWQLAPAERVIGAGTLTIAGAVVSTTCRETFAAELLPAASVTVTTILFWPMPIGVPAAGFWLSTNWLAG